ncbi:hypothetical protein ABEW05_002857 [Botrytis cinerea]
MSIFGSSSSSAIEAMNQRPATQHVERNQRESQEEAAQKSKIIILRVPAASLAELDPPSKPSLIVKLNIKMFDINIQPCVSVDPSFAVHSALDDQTTDQRNLNSAAHTAANAQSSVRAKPPIALSINNAIREYALEISKLLEQPLPQFPGMPRMPFGRACFSTEVDILLSVKENICISE